MGNFAGEYKISCILERLNGTIILYFFYKDYLRIFKPRKKYLRFPDKPELKIIKKIRI